MTFATQTRIEENPALVSMRAMASFLILEHLDWRHHGIGCLQAYVPTESGPEVRLHIWSPKLIKPGIEGNGDIHDHRFDMVSHVLLGTVYHEEIEATPDPAGDYGAFRVTHARAAADNNYHGPTEPLTGQRFSLERHVFGITEGLTYRYPAGRFHRSPLLADRPDDITVTCVEKHNQRATPARVLHPTRLEPVMAFGHELDERIANDILHEAARMLGGYGRRG